MARLRLQGISVIVLGTSDYFTSEVLSASDYYPFGLEMTGRDFTNGGHRFGFNGKEDDPEFGSGVQDYGFRIYNKKIAKFLSVDPLTRKYPFYTPYQFAGNKPIYASDIDGLEEDEEVVPDQNNKPTLVNRITQWWRNFEFRKDFLSGDIGPQYKGPVYLEFEYEGVHIKIKGELEWVGLATTGTIGIKKDKGALFPMPIFRLGEVNEDGVRVIPFTHKLAFQQEGMPEVGEDVGLTLEIKGAWYDVTQWSITKAEVKGAIKDDLKRKDQLSIEFINDKSETSVSGYYTLSVDQTEAIRIGLVGKEGGTDQVIQVNELFSIKITSSGTPEIEEGGDDSPSDDSPSDECSDECGND